MADLGRSATCAVRFSDGARTIATTVGPEAPLLAPSLERLLELVRTGVCDAAVVDVAAIRRFVAGRGALLGPVPARVPSEAATSSPSRAMGRSRSRT